MISSGAAFDLHSGKSFNRVAVLFHFSDIFSLLHVFVLSFPFFFFFFFFFLLQEWTLCGCTSHPYTYIHIYRSDDNFSMYWSTSNVIIIWILNTPKWICLSYSFKMYNLNLKNKANPCSLWKLNVNVLSEIKLNIIL